MLKGGSGMLARIPDARTTRDVDLALRSERKESVETVIGDFTALVGQDLGDMFTFALDCNLTAEPLRMNPENRIEVPGMVVGEYLLYPLADQITDKICATMEIYLGGYPSSHMEDLVDLVLIATKMIVHAEELSLAIHMEAGRRDMEVLTSFKAPESWAGSFAAFARKSGLNEAYCNFQIAEGVVKTFLDPVLSADVMQGEWDMESQRWAEALS